MEKHPNEIGENKPIELSDFQLNFEVLSRNLV